MRGVYDANGILQLSPNGNELVKVEYTKIHHQWQASVFINNMCIGYVTFGMNNERIVSTFAQGFADDGRAETSIHNIVAGIH
ncbi:hypothetical protein [Vibrio phage pTD1]|uniref:Phage protein n=1 Tax=Vibrio phage pTD1 TaxID=1938577 RepID=A0A1Q2U2R6_9CAUD|nr:hypothetical protein FDH33_gp041 [Vibrio phage pTD1]BAW98250.1 hypothetical protein [Vibrio phage pTD1]